MAKNYVADGALFKDAPINDGKVRPIMHVALTVCGVNLNLAVWPKKASPNGTVYWPVTGDYSRNETKRLVDVTPVMNASAAQTVAPQAPQPTAPQPTVAASDEGGDLPF